MALYGETSKVVRLPIIVIEHIKSKRQEGESFNDVHARLLGINLSDNKVQSKQLAKNPEIATAITVLFFNYLDSTDTMGMVEKGKEANLRDFTQFCHVKFAQTKKYVLIQEKYPQLMVKTNNGQTRLAHVIKSVVRRIYKNIKDDKPSYYKPE